jgi:hypothetical protein
MWRSRQVRWSPLRRLQRLPVWRTRLLRNRHRVRMGLQLQLLLVMGILPALLVTTLSQPGEALPHYGDPYR